MDLHWDGNLPAAVDRFGAAVGAVVDPVKELVDGRVYVTDSLYSRLREAIPAARSSTGYGYLNGHARPRSPLFLDAVDLCAEIDAQVASWRPNGPDTEGRLRAIAAARWRPQDAAVLHGWADTLNRWAASIAALLDPDSVKTINEACPACGTRIVYRRDRAGETVRTPALQLVIETGCRCLSCDTHWPPSQYMFLCKLLGLDLPAGIIT